MYEEKDLAWIDLSHNLLTEIDYVKINFIQK